MYLELKHILYTYLYISIIIFYSIQQWLREGNLGKLDQLVLSGCGDLLLEKKSTNPDTQIFLQELPPLLVGLC